MQVDPDTRNPRYDWHETLLTAAVLSATSSGDIQFGDPTYGPTTRADDIVDFLLKVGADPDLQTMKAFRGPVNIAADRADIGILKTLVEAGASLEIRDHLGRTPLMTASANASYGTCDFLLTSGAAVDNYSVRVENGKMIIDSRHNAVCLVGVGTRYYYLDDKARQGFRNVFDRIRRLLAEKASETTMAHLGKCKIKIHDPH